MNLINKKAICRGIGGALCDVGLPLLVSVKRALVGSLNKCQKSKQLCRRTNLN